MLNTRERILFGLLYPLLILVAGLVLIMSLPSGAAAAEFASLGVLLGTIIVTPFLIVANVAMAWTIDGSKSSCFTRGMILPGLVLATALAYQLGLLDAVL